MGIRKCIVTDCPSTSARVEDRGVTYHKIPANEEAKKKWILACRLPEGFVINTGSNVCSRHFRKADFQEFKGTKYVLKSGAIPTIFSWTIASVPGKQKEEETVVIKQEKNDETLDIKEALPNEAEQSSTITPVTEETSQPDEDKNESTTTSQPENNGDINVKHEVADDDVILKDIAPISPVSTKRRSTPGPKRKSASKRLSLTKHSASPKRARKSDGGRNTPKEKKSISPRKSTGNTANVAGQPQINFTPGTSIEAQDFSGKWHPAKLVEIDTEDREVLVQFDRSDKSKPILNDEWIPMDSVRLRPLQDQVQVSNTSNEKVAFIIGEKCYARWSDSRKFRATVQKILDNDMYEVLFDDGFVKICKASHMSKLKRGDQNQDTDSICSPTNANPNTSSNETPITPIRQITTPKIPQVAKVSDFPEIPKDGEWCCHWMNDFPVGEEGVLELSGVLVHTVIVADWRLPEGWIKHIYQRFSAYGKMEVVLVDPEGRRFRTRQEMKAFFAEKGEPFDPNIYDFGLHKRRAKELGFTGHTKEYKEALLTPSLAMHPALLNTEVNIGSVKVKIVDNLFQCPDQDCLKTFRKENHLQIHIKHYHKEIAKGLGEIPNMQDLAALRTPVEIIDTPPKTHRRSSAKIQIKDEPKKDEMVVKKEPNEEQAESFIDTKKDDDTTEPVIKKEKLESAEEKLSPESKSSPREVKCNDPEISVTTPICAPEPVSTQVPETVVKTSSNNKPTKRGHKIKLFARKKKITKKTKTGFISKRMGGIPGRKRRKKISVSRSSVDCMEAEETRHSFTTTPNESFFRPGYGYEKDPDGSQTTNVSICGQYGDDSINAAVGSPRFINENGEVIKIVSMKKEEIINCLCGYPEEDGLMVQCELCLCWQHGICNGFEKDTQVPDKYICSICRNPLGGRESRRYIHDQDWLYEGKLPVANYHASNSKHTARFDILKQSHMLAGNLLELKRFMHSLKIKINIAEKKDHPKMYLWSKKWEKSPPRGGNGDLSGIVPLNSCSSATSTSGITQCGGNKTEVKPIIPHIPVPEAAIDPAECQTILMEHIQKQQNSAMARLQAIEAQIIALEAYDEKSDLLESPTAKNYPKTKQTIHMLLNDLVKVKKVATIHRSAQPPHVL